MTGNYMKTPINIIIDSNLKKEASELFANLGLDLSTAVNIFLYQCVLRGEIPFKTEMPPNLNNQYFASKIGTPYNPENKSTSDDDTSKK